MKNSFRNWGELLDQQKGFTFVEVVIVMIIIGIFFGMSMLYLQSSQIQSDLRAQSSDIVSNLRTQQAHAASGKEDSSFGIHLENDRYVLFTGSFYVEEAASNVDINLPPALHITDIALNDDGSDVVFFPPHGETNNHGSFSIVADDGSSKNITITQIGTIDY